MIPSKKIVAVRMDANLYAKLKYIATEEGRTKPRQACQFIRHSILQYEKEHGEIPVD